MLSNLNWQITSISHVLFSFYHIAAYIIRGAPDESKLLRLSFVGLLSMCHILFVALSYFSDHQKKMNFCNEIVLTKKKENLRQILECYPDILMIVNKKVTDEASEFGSKNRRLKCCVRKCKDCFNS